MSDITTYQRTLKQRQDAHLAELARRQQQGWILANQAAELLTQIYGAKQGMLFGSLVHGHWFSTTSDIDLAVWGLDKLTYLTAVSRLQDLSPEFKIDLIRMEQCQPDLKQAILQDGRPAIANSFCKWFNLFTEYSLIHHPER